MSIYALVSLMVMSVVTGASVDEVAFSAGVTTNLNLSQHETVIFDRLFTNAGNGYSTTTGIFTCPMTGYYVFQFHTLAQQGKSSWLELYHNAYYLASVYGHTANDYSSAGNSVIIRVDKGDQVFVKAVDPKWGDATNIYGLDDEVYSTFSGYLVAPILEELPAVGK